MARNNDVHNVLVTKGNQALLPKGKRVYDLAPGQLGIFNFSTGESFDATEAKVKDFFLAVGVDTEGEGNTTDVSKSAGSHIQSKNVVFYSHKAYQAPEDMIIEFKDYVADCETEYGLKLEFRNQEIYRTQGFVQYTKPYVFKSGCCKACDTSCPSLDQNEITLGLYLAMTRDEERFVTAYMVEDKGTPFTDLANETILSVEDVEGFIEDNKAEEDETLHKKTKLLIKSNSQRIHNFCDVNLKYFYPRQTVIIPTKLDGFKCNGKLSIVKDVVYEQGSGYDVKQLEYYTLGFKEPYRLHSILGVAKQVEYNADAKAKYDIFALTYDQFSIGAWLEYYHNEATIVAVPKDDSVTINALKAIFVAQEIEPTV